MTFIRTTVVAFLLSIAAPALATAQALGTDAPAPAPWVQHMDQQVHTLLTFPNATTQEEAMQLILQLAERTDAQGETLFTFGKAIKPLKAIYTSDDHLGRRLLALEALRVIGGTEVTLALQAQLAEEPSTFVRKRTAVALSTLP